MDAFAAYMEGPSFRCISDRHHTVEIAEEADNEKRTLDKKEVNEEKAAADKEPRRSLTINFLTAPRSPLEAP